MKVRKAKKLIIHLSADLETGYTYLMCHIMLQNCKGFEVGRKVMLICHCLLFVSVKREMLESAAELRVGCVPGYKQNTSTVNKLH
jgi:hypothetical protein